MRCPPEHSRAHDHELRLASRGRQTEARTHAHQYCDEIRAGGDVTQTDPALALGRRFDPANIRAFNERLRFAERPNVRVDSARRRCASLSNALLCCCSLNSNSEDLDAGLFCGKAQLFVIGGRENNASDFLSSFLSPIFPDVSHISEQLTYHRIGTVDGFEFQDHKVFLFIKTN